MNPLDDLISSSSRVPGVTPDGLGRGRAALDGAIAARARQESPARRKAAAHWFGGLRGKAIIGVAGVAAVAVAATVIALPSSPSHTAGTPRADSSAKPAVKAPAKPKPPGQTSTSPVTYSITATKTDVTAAYVFAQAAKGTQAQETPDANVPLVNGWPNALYWHTLSQDTSPDCPGLARTSETWLAKSGAEVVKNQDKGSVPASDDRQCIGPTDNSVYPVSGNPAGPMIGGKIYTWAQFAALPTDPAELWPILQADSTVGVASEKGEPEQVFLFQTISLLLTADPVSPAMRVALFELAEKIPGVTVAGKYTDSLGRTGIALRQGSESVVIDTSNGQVLADVIAEPAHPGCTTIKATSNSTSSTTSYACNIGDVTVYISEGPVNTEPYVKLAPGGVGEGPAPSSSAVAKASQAAASQAAQG
jgi:hypothetical protein